MLTVLSSELDQGSY